MTVRRWTSWPCLIDNFLSQNCGIAIKRSGIQSRHSRASFLKIGGVNRIVMSQRWLLEPVIEIEGVLGRHLKICNVKGI